MLLGSRVSGAAGKAAITVLALASTVGSTSAPALAIPARSTSAPTLAVPSRSAGRTAAHVLAQLTLRQKVGQLFMVGTPATSASLATRSQITRYHVGNVMLTGRSYGGTGAPARVAATMQARTTRAATDGVRLLVATDQEGGQVQVLHGPGFSEIPSAREQGRWYPSALQTRAGRWARQLRSVGVTMDLAPVEDTVPGLRAADHNPPIGAFDREFGYTTRVVAHHGRAFVRGLSRHGVVPAIKHFPGLGRVSANTDTSAGVTDRVTTRHDAYLWPFAVSIRAGAPVVMISNAFYSQIDRRNPGPFSPRIVRTMLRGDLGFRGVAMSDDLADARQLSPWRWGVRAVRFIGAGGNLVLAVNPRVLPEMYSAVLRRAEHRPSFRAKVNSSALRILRLKQARGLL
ncbi:MAG: glycoside hydrolase family 3 N-terminal domain-containing protein [Nocardioides sp.]